ncbi:hybrid sensor histidine kinase/response regulator [Roseateles violae]|uniref:histidine kinase n=1 Tax=Roseateles violae TaxID=3058042 RepID=A0ABT8DWN4_9BURK|nr:response regulator [Pelomonas sp. PFR6]MDN3920759.1 response regulator [Pelomonas sp. PFR6]
MRIRDTSRRLTLLVCVLSLLSLGFFLWSGIAADQRKEALSSQLSDTLAALEFRQGSDVLTAAMRAYAATGDERYRREFETELHQTRQRELAIAKLAETGSGERESMLLEKAKRQSDALVLLEQRIFELTNSGRREDAIALAYGEEYRNRKAAVLAPINQILAEVAERRSAEVDQALTRVYWTRILATLITLLNLGVVLSVLLGYFMRRVVVPLTTMSRLLQRLDAGERGLSFREPAAAGELRELGEMLETHARVLEELEVQRQALQLSEQQQRFIFNTAASGIAWTKGRVIIDCNERCCQQFGLSRDELIGMHSAALFEGGDAARSAILASQASLAAGGVYRGEERMVGAQGRLFWARLCGRMIDPARPELGSVWVVDDISAEHEAAERMEEAQRLAEEAARVKSSFLANMSHEIRTPMNAIIGMAHLLGLTPLDERQADYLRRLDVSSQHLLGLLNDVLDFSKLEAGRLDVEAIEFDLERMCENVCTLITGGAEAKGLEVVLHLAPDLPRSLRGDPMRLSQILINYLNNAVKFTSAGQIYLRVEGRRLQGQELMLRFEVRDTGVGLSEAQSAQLFQSFEQADASTTRRFGGTGLGLAIAKGLAQLMGGEVGVFSRPGVGSSFWFTARLAVSDTSPAAIAPPPSLLGRRVLVADDNESARTLLGKMLGHLGMQSVEVESGLAALDALKRAADEGQAFDLACIDWQMPKMDGIRVAEEIAALNLAKPPRIMLVTAFGRPELRQLARRVKVAHVLGKPITASALLDTIQAVLQGETVPAPHRLAAASGAAPWSGRRVLLAEDNETNQIVARDLLDSWGLEVEIARDGIEAVDKALRRHYDLVLMDVHMPAMDGLHATRRLRQEPRLATLPILAMTASAMSEDRQRCLDAGMNDHIAKPIAPGRLMAKLQQWLGAHEAGAADDGPDDASTPVDGDADAADAMPVMRALESAGLRVRDALGRMSGRSQLYLELLQRFAVEQASTMDRIASAWQHGDRSAAVQQTHALRGAAGTLGAIEVEGRAMALETVLGNSTSSANLCADRLDDLTQAMQSLLAALASCLPRRRSGSELASQESLSLADDLADIKTQITNALENNDFGAYRLILRHEQVLKRTLGADYLALRAATDRFDFELARSLWRELLVALNRPGDAAVSGHEGVEHSRSKQPF